MIQFCYERLFEGTETVACRLSPVATDGMDGNALKFEKTGQFFSIFDATYAKNLKKFVMVSPL